MLLNSLQLSNIKIFSYVADQAIYCFAWSETFNSLGDFGTFIQKFSFLTVNEICGDQPTQSALLRSVEFYTFMVNLTILAFALWSFKSFL